MLSFSLRNLVISFCMSSKTSLLILTVSMYSFRHRMASEISPAPVLPRPSLFLASSSRLRQLRTRPSVQLFQTELIIQIITVAYHSPLPFLSLGSDSPVECMVGWLGLQNIILKLTASMQNKEKRQAGVARSKFIDRIKSSADFHQDHKENLNLNDIRQSGYKLPRSRSNPRYDHSLERKQPIRIAKDALNNSQEPTPSDVTLQNTLKDNVYALTANNTVKLDGFHNGSFSDDKQAVSGRSQPDCSGEFNQAELGQEEQALDIIKSIWESSIKMKEKGLFKDQMGRIQNILKEIIVEIAKPKFNSIQESSSLSLKVPEVKFSPFQNVTSFKQSKRPSNNNSVNEFRTHTKRQEQGRGTYANYESDAEEELQFKKIMYILQEKSKLTRIAPQPSSLSKQGRELKQISDILNIKTSCYSSSFNCSSREPSGLTIREYQKVSNSRSNDRVFLKNIVKKAKASSVSNIEEAEREVFEKRSGSDVSFLNSEEQFANSAISEQEQSEQNSSLQYETPLSDASKVENKYSFAGGKADPIKIEALQTLQDESESKRVVLNQIIAMLNNKYHKNIKLQPRRH